ncbi:MAG: hypothetical protein JXB49_31045 [Bacteroidales bacterium]|nr:hypothetical protein [Bacteroidales bacterium]MBN2820723.1 hypothetical protein [Bacteroidales bacterium]
MGIKLKCLILLLICYNSICCFSQADTLHLNLNNPFPNYSTLFQSDTILNITLKFNIKEFQKEKLSGDYVPAELIMDSGEENVIKKDIKIKARGIYRLNMCSFPPLWIQVQKIKKTDSTNKSIKKVKLVTHCNPSSTYDDYILREYLAYKIFNIISPYSYRVRLLNITYIDTGRKNKTITRYGYFIEPTEDMAGRLNAMEIKLDAVGFFATDERQTDLVSMWAYMMGNTDWSVTGRHNIKLLKTNTTESHKLIPVPYDFDFTGFVNTSYAVPKEGSGLENVRQRLYTGPCRKLIEYNIAAQHLLLKKKEIYSLINDFEYLEEHSKKELIDYLEQFYINIQKPNFIKYHLDIDCIEVK